VGKGQQKVQSKGFGESALVAAGIPTSANRDRISDIFPLTRHKHFTVTGASME
jgi:hypothetical protein